MDPVLHIGRWIWHLIQPLDIGLIFREQQLQRSLIWRPHVPPTFPQRLVFGVSGARADGFDRGARYTRLPRPDVAIPEMRQNVDRSGIGTAIDRRDAAEDVFGVCLGVFDEHIEITIA